MALIDGHFEASVMKHPGQGISFGWACGINLVPEAKLMALIDGHFEAPEMKHPGQGISVGWACGINLVPEARLRDATKNIF